MNIDVDQRCLGAVDMQDLKQRILAQEPEVWAEQTIRQQTYEVHKDTESIVMLFCDESWPDGEIYRESGWERLADVAMPMIDYIINTYYAPGGTLLRAMAVKLKGQGRIHPHRLNPVAQVVVFEPLRGSEWHAEKAFAFEVEYLREGAVANLLHLDHDINGDAIPLNREGLKHDRSLEVSPSLVCLGEGAVYSRNGDLGSKRRKHAVGVQIQPHRDAHVLDRLAVGAAHDYAGDWRHD